MTPQINPGYIEALLTTDDHTRVGGGKFLKINYLGGSLLAGESPWKFSMVRRWWLFCWRLYIFIAIFQRHYSKQFRGNLAFTSIYSIIPNGLFSNFLQYSLYSYHDFMAFIFRKKGAPSTDARWIFASTICQEPGNSWKVCAWLHWKSFGLAASPTLWSHSCNHHDLSIATHVKCEGADESSSFLQLLNYLAQVCCRRHPNMGEMRFYPLELYSSELLPHFGQSHWPIVLLSRMRISSLRRDLQGPV